MNTEITLVAFDPAARSVTIRAHGEEKTIEGLGDFPSKSAFVEFLQSVAETDLKPLAGKPLPDVAQYVGKKLPTVESLKETEEVSGLESNEVRP